LRNELAEIKAQLEVLMTVVRSASGALNRHAPIADGRHRRSHRCSQLHAFQLGI